MPDCLSRMKLDDQSPIYLQICAFVKQSIASGDLKPGAELPSRRALAARLGINPMTVQKAYQQLEMEDLLHTQPNAVSLVSQDPELQSVIRRQLADSEIRRFVRQARQLQLGFKDVIDQISACWNEADEGDNDA